MSIFQSVIKNITLIIRNAILLIILLIINSHLVANEYNENAMNLIHQDSTIIFKSNSEESHHSIHINGEDVKLPWVIPFIGILLSIAIFPLVKPHIWHRHYGKISLFWSLSFFIPFWLTHGTSTAFFYSSEVFFLKYFCKFL